MTTIQTTLRYKAELLQVAKWVANIRLTIYEKKTKMKLLKYLKTKKIYLPSFKILQDTEVKTYYTWQAKNKYRGKKFSILGDSISTLYGYNPDGYKVFYEGDKCQKAGINKVLDTWWGKVIDFYGGKLLVNNSWSGSRVSWNQKCISRLSTNDMFFPSGCSAERTSNLHLTKKYTKKKLEPDIIIIYLGTNDWGFGTNLLKDFYKSQNNYTSFPDEKFFDIAYTEMLKKIRNHYKKSEIWCCSLMTTYISGKDFKFPYSHAGTHMEEYNEVIHRCVEECYWKHGDRNIKYIDTYKYRVPYDSIDGSHPTAKGMNEIAALILRETADETAQNLLDCRERQHSYILAEQTVDTLEYVCKKCGYRNPVPIIHTLDKRPSNKTHSVSSENVSNNIIATSFEKNTSLENELSLKVFLQSTSKEIEIKNIKTIMLGRGKDCEINLNLGHDTNKYIARIHAAIIWHVDNWYLYDNHSMNGTWLNGRKLEQGKKYILHHNDVIDVAHSEKIVFLEVREK